MFLVTQLFTKQSENNQRIAVCQATYTQKTAPTLHWEPALNFSSSNSSVKKHGRFFTMENQVYLPDNVNISELICVATYTSESGSVQHKSTLHLKQSEYTVYEKKLRIDFISASTFCVAVYLATGTFMSYRGWFKKKKKKNSYETLPFIISIF